MRALHASFRPTYPAADILVVTEVSRFGPLARA